MHKNSFTGNDKIIGTKDINEHLQQYAYPKAGTIIHAVAAAIKNADPALEVFLDGIPLQSNQFFPSLYANAVKEFIKDGFLKMAEQNTSLFPANVPFENKALLRNAICMEICAASDIFHCVNVGRDAAKTCFIDPNHQTFGLHERFSPLLPEQHAMFLIPTKALMDQFFLSGYGARLDPAASHNAAKPSP